MKTISFDKKFESLKDTMLKTSIFEKSSNSSFKKSESLVVLVFTIVSEEIKKGPKKRKHTNFGMLSLRVDPQRIELWSKQALNMLSTCVADY